MTKLNPFKYLCTCSKSTCTNCYRRLVAEDAPLIVELLRAIYGETYSYSDYYNPSFLEGLLNSESLIAFGVFNEDSELVGHTALITKDISSDYFESGMTMRHPRRKTVCKELEEELFQYIFHLAKEKSYYIHQNTTTYHQFAQATARKYMKTKYCGLTFGYTSGENIRNLEHTNSDMNAVIYTTVLREESPLKDVFLPNGQWGEWLSQIFHNVDSRKNIKFCDSLENNTQDMYLTEIEENSHLGLNRFAVCDRDFMQVHFNPNLDVKTMLIHLPARKELVQKYFNYLIANNFLPIGIRPHHNRWDEIIFQRLNLSDDLEDISNTKLFWKDERQFFNDWCQLCQQTI